jgi:hypothetical protein
VSFDDLVRRAGDRLARPASRRRFVGAVGLGTAAVASGGLVGCGGDDSKGATKKQRRIPFQDENFRSVPASRVPKGAVGQDAVAVCYSPYVVTGTEPSTKKLGRTGVAVRKGPHPDAEIVLTNAGDEVFVHQGAHFARQSDREAPGCASPPMRKEIDGWIWGYPGNDVRSKKSGWIPLRIDGKTYTEAAPDYRDQPKNDGWFCGPARKDFDCRDAVASQKACGHDDCGGPPLDDIRCRATPLRRRVREAATRKASNFEDYYLRLSFNSTAFGWVEPGDVVDELCRRSAPSYAVCCVEWSFVEIVRSEALPKGTRGWMLETGLARKGRKPLSRTGPPGNYRKG